MSNTSVKYNSKRPFLVINVTHKPGKTVNTSVRGWGSTPSNWSSFERPTIVDRVKPKHLTDATVIIDVMNGKVIKSRYEDDEQALVSHYLEKYREPVKEAMDVWLTKLAHEKAKAVSAG